MTKKKLSKLQQRRIKEKNEKKFLNKNEESSLIKFDGVVIRRFVKIANVESRDGIVYRCDIRRTLKSLVTGDNVLFSINDSSTNKGVIEAIYPRTSELVRPDFYDGIKVVAANIDQILIIFSTKPELSLNILDRYLVACSATGIKPVLVLNKIDLLNKTEMQDLSLKLDYYFQQGYRLLKISCKNDDDLAELKNLLKDNNSILVGQSGVGKSSIINRLIPELTDNISVGNISDISGLGKHTTTATSLYHLSFGGNIIDSPGVREFGLWHLDPSVIISGFPEFYHYLGDCKFRDCNHLTDLNCGLKQAVSSGKIAQWRFDNYHQILQSMKEVKAKTNRTFSMLK